MAIALPVGAVMSGVLIQGLMHFALKEGINPAAAQLIISVKPEHGSLHARENPL